MRLNLLGPVELLGDNGAAVEIGPNKRRAVLAVLALELNQVVPVSKLLHVLWDGRPPPAARTALQGHVSALRKILGPDLRLLTRDPGYELRADPGAVDAARFRALVAAARPGAVETVDRLRTALGLWRGPALADLIGHGLPGGLVASLDDERRDTLTLLAGQCLELGRGGEVVRELRAAVVDAPLHEPLIRALMLCLRQADRQADALEVYHNARHLLADEIGVDPGPALRQAYQAVLQSAGPPPPRPAAPAPSHPPPPGDRTAGGPLAAGPPAPAQLPRAPAGFAGRRRELDWLRARLDAEGLALVTGPAGVGKTALVLRWAHEVADRFPDGQLHLNLRGFDPGGPLSTEAALTSLLRSLGAADTGRLGEVADRAALYRTRMSGRRILLVLDDAHSAEQIGPLLPGTPHSQVVVTSRHSLSALIAREGAAALSLAPLGDGEALELLAHALGRGRAEAEPDAALRLTELCDNMPLALRVAAARLVVSPQWTLSALADELLDEQARLSVLSTDDAQMSVEAALTLTYRVLPEPAARLFTLLGVYPGADVDRHAAAALSGTDPAAAHRALTALTGCHLAYQSRPGRFAAHDLVRLYSRQLAARTLAPAEVDAVHGRLFDYYHEAALAARSATAETPGPPGSGVALVPRFVDVAAAFDWFAAQEQAIRGLIRSTRLHERAWRLARTCFALYIGSGDLVAQIECTTAGIEAARAAGDKSAVSNLLAMVGPQLAQLGQTERALGFLEEAAGLIDDGSADLDRFHVFCNLAKVECAADRWEQAQRHFGQAYAAAAKLGEPAREAFVLNSLAWNCVVRGQPDRALEYTRRALDLLEGLPIRAVHLSVQDTRAHALARLGRLEEARAIVQSVVDTAQANGFRRNLAVSCHSLGAVLIRLGRKPEARTHLQLALDLFTEQGNREAENVRDLLHSIPGL